MVLTAPAAARRSGVVPHRPSPRRAALLRGTLPLCPRLRPQLSSIRAQLRSAASPGTPADCQPSGPPPAAARRVGAPALQSPRHWTAVSLPSLLPYFIWFYGTNFVRCVPASPHRPLSSSGHKHKLFLIRLLCTGMGRQSRPVPFPGARGFPFPVQGAGAGLSPLPLYFLLGARESRTSRRLPQPPFASRLRDFQLSPFLSSCFSARLPAAFSIFPVSDLSPSQRRHKAKYSRMLQVYKYSSERASKSLEGKEECVRRQKAKHRSAAADALVMLGFRGGGPSPFAVCLGGIFSGAGRWR